MKKHIGIRVDENLKAVLEDARKLSGIPISEILRKGALSEAFRIISMFKGQLRHVASKRQLTLISSGGKQINKENL